jgi:hypothetical protein
VKNAATELAPRARADGSFLVAHRAGNDLMRLRRAQALGVGLIEADLHLFRGRVEARHLKTVGPLPIFWDRWTLAPPWAARLQLDRLLQAAVGGSELMLDLKGRDRRLPRLVAAALAEHSGLPVTVCSQRWSLLEPLRDSDGVRLVHSVGSERQLARLRRRYAGSRLAGVSIHRRLLSPTVVRELRECAELVMTWPVEHSAQARMLVGWGVHGLITSHFDKLEPVVGTARGAG